MLRRMLRRLPGLWLLIACAAPGGPPPSAPLVFVRSRGAWAPEELHRDVAACIDASHAAILAEPFYLESPPGTARGALRERTVACMDERGWTTGSAEPEEWAQ
jgi:hypothetical protein